MDRLDSRSDPLHHRPSHRVAKRAIAWPVSRRLAAIGDERVVVGEALKPFTLARREATDGHSSSDLAGVAVAQRHRLRDFIPYERVACAANAVSHHWRIAPAGVAVRIQRVHHRTGSHFADLILCEGDRQQRLALGVDAAHPASVQTHCHK